MARHEHDREDLLREATALVHRGQWLLADGTSVIIGFRRDGSASIFLGEDPVYHFNSRVQLRRAYSKGFLLKAERGQLARLTRVRTTQAVQLVRHELSAAEATEFLGTVAANLAKLRRDLSLPATTLVGEVPPGEGLLERLATFLANFVETIEVAQSPRAG